MKFHQHLKVQHGFIIKSGFPKFIYCKEKDRFAYGKRILFIDKY